MYRRKNVVRGCGYLRIRHREYKRKRRRSDPSFKLRCNISATIGLYIKRNIITKKSSIWSKLQYTPQQLKEHLAKQFESWMNWDNYGSPSIKRQTWNIDHIIPQSAYPYDSLDHPNFVKCWSFENLRPYDAIENIIKGDKYD